MPRDSPARRTTVEWWERNRVTVALVLASGLVGAGLVLLLDRPQPPPIRVIQPTSVPTPSEIVVHVIGAVTTPGVYRLPTDARVFDAVELAGGATSEADVHSVNLAAPVRDGQRVVIPDLRSVADAETAPAGAAGPGQALIDLNRAGQAVLETLPGVGPVTAGRIMDRRERDGRFDYVEQLLEERIVNQSVYERIKDMVTVD